MQLWRSQKGTSGFFQNHIFEISRKREKRAVAHLPSKVKYTVFPSAVLESAPFSDYRGWQINLVDIGKWPNMPVCSFNLPCTKIQ